MNRPPISLRIRNLIDALVAKRERLGWTQGDVARILGTSKQHVQQLESMTYSPSLQSLIRWGDALGITVRLIDMDARPARRLFRTPRAKTAEAIHAPT